MAQSKQVICFSRIKLLNYWYWYHCHVTVILCTTYRTKNLTKSLHWPKLTYLAMHNLYIHQLFSSLFQKRLVNYCQHRPTASIKSNTFMNVTKRIDEVWQWISQHKDIESLVWAVRINMFEYSNKHEIIIHSKVAQDSNITKVAVENQVYQKLQ